VSLGRDEIESGARRRFSGQPRWLVGVAALDAGHDAGRPDPGIRRTVKTAQRGRRDVGDQVQGARDGGEPGAGMRPAVS